MNDSGTFILVKMADHAPVATLRAVLLRWVRDRIKAGETQDEVGARLGIGRTQMNQTISGKIPKKSKRPRSFTVEHIDNAARSLDVSLGAFLHRLGEIATEIDTEERIVAQPVDSGAGRSARVLVDPETAARLSPPPEEPPPTEPAPPKKRQR